MVSALLTVRVDATSPVGEVDCIGGACAVNTTVTSQVVTATASEGIAPYTYAWTRVGGSTAMVATTPAAAATTFHATLSRNTVMTSVFQCTVTDNVAKTAVSALVSVRLSYEWDSGL